jgi:ABC-type Fe3+-hydroxamate transport system substrate-binding protein
LALEGARTFVDQMGRTVETKWPPERIVSLVPSQTELLFDLDLAQQIAGVTRYCVRPARAVADLPRVGGTKNVSLEKVLALSPDLIIGNKEENERENIEDLARHFPVWLSDITTLPDALAMIRALGEVTDRRPRADALAGEIATGFDRPRPNETIRVAYLIWRKPMMAVGGGTFIHDLLERCGFSNAFAHSRFGRYPEVTGADLSKADPDALLLSSEPFPFTTKHLAEFQAQCPRADVKLVDGEMFSWPGSRLTRSAAYLFDLAQTLSQSSKASQ